MIDLKEYEVWFVTGSQHLYGPKTLETVAEHSREIAAVLGGTGHMDAYLLARQNVDRAFKSTQETLPAFACAI